MVIETKFSVATLPSTSIYVGLSMYEFNQFIYTIVLVTN